MTNKEKYHIVADVDKHHIGKYIRKIDPRGQCLVVKILSVDYVNLFVMVEIVYSTWYSPITGIRHKKVGTTYEACPSIIIDTNFVDGETFKLLYL